MQGKIRAECDHLGLLGVAALSEDWEDKQKPSYEHKCALTTFTKKL